jgi:hypothetical protein
MTTSKKQARHEATSPNTRHATGFIPNPAARFRRHGQSPVFQQFARNWPLLVVTLFLALVCPAARAASPQFAPIPALNFSATVAGDAPLSQVITANSTGASIFFTAAASTNSGGNWLSINPTANEIGYGVYTPYGITVQVNPAVTLTAGTYTGQIVLTCSSQSCGTTPLEIPVTLVMHAPSTAYFDQIAGGLNFSLATGGNNPPAQPLQVRNAGTGSLAWTATTSTADGGNWLTLSSASGTAPTNVSVGITIANLPGAGATAGTFTGQVLFTSSGDTESVPITVNVGSDVIAQVNPLNFNKTFAGPEPLAQQITISSTASGVQFQATVGSSTGVTYTGNNNQTVVPWLIITPSNYGYYVPTPYNIAVSVNPAVTLGPGTYMAQIIINQTNGDSATTPNGTQTVTIPVSLTVYPAATSYFDNVAGELNFSMATGAEVTGPPSQDLQIRDAIPADTINWTATLTTADGGNWLSASVNTGTTPSIVTISVNPAMLPASTLVAATYVGQILLTSSSGRVTIPVSFQLAASAFRQVNPINFTMVQGAASPLSQVVTIASTGAPIGFLASVVSANGVTYTGTNNSTVVPWLSISPTTADQGYYLTTPYGIVVSVNPAITLTAGTYTAEIIVTTQNAVGLYLSGAETMTIPVTLTIEPPTATFFDATPGSMNFFMATGSTTGPPAQTLPIRNGGEGTLDWTATVTTADGGNWLSISADSGTAPSTPTVSVNPANIAGGGLTAGTFTGTISLQQGGQEISIPVSFTVAASVFNQINPLNFTMIQGGANPLSQVLTVGSAGAGIGFQATVASATGVTFTTANHTVVPWLSITPSNYGYYVPTPYTVVASVNTAATLTAGTYSAEIIIVSQNGDGQNIAGAQVMNVPVTLTVMPPAATAFDSLPGELTFSMATGGKAPPSQPLEIRNAGTGTLNWTATVTTSDGGGWLTMSSLSGTAPSIPQISVNPAKITGGGLLGGTFTGQIVLETAGNTVTIPVAYNVGTAVYSQVNGLDFNMVAGGDSPLPQLISIPGTGAAILSVASVSTSTGGNWLNITPAVNTYGYGYNTPFQMIVSPHPAVTLGPGKYTAEITLIQDAAPQQSMVIPVTLTINPPSAAFFNDMQGGATFSVITGSNTNPPSQTIPIRNAGVGTLNWTATTSTADGGNWLSLSSMSGTAPDTLTVSINYANLPNAALIGGQFNGQIVLANGTDLETIPVAVVVGTNLFAPVSPLLTFKKPYGGANPGFQLMTITSDGSTNFPFFGVAASANGGDWLSISPSNFGYGIPTPAGIQVSADPVATVVPGTYIGETIYYSQDQTQGLVVPVTLNVYAVPAATPTFLPGSGLFYTPQTVKIATTTPNATIFYTIDGTAPSTAATLYTGPFKVSKSATVKAVVYAPNYLPSAVGEASYVIGVQTPVIKPEGGTFTKVQMVTITDLTSSATIYYTTNGAAPTDGSTKYTKPIAVDQNETIKAIAYATGYANSAVATAKFTIKLPAATPLFSMPTNKYPAPISVAITDATKDAAIYYTINGRTPTTASTKYTKPIMVSENETINAIAIAPGGSESPVATVSYIIAAATPVITPRGGSILSGTTVAITDASKGTTIYYTINNTVPTTSSKHYTGPIKMTTLGSVTIKAIAVGSDYAESAVATEKFAVVTAK